MNKGKYKWLLLVPSLVGPLSVFHYLLTKVAGCGLDAQCNPLVVMRIIMTNCVNGMGAMWLRVSVSPIDKFTTWCPPRFLLVGCK